MQQQINQAEQRLSMPTMGLMITAVLGVVAGVASAGLNMIMAGLYLTQGNTPYDQMNVAVSLLSALFSVAGVAAAVFVGYAAVKIQNLETYGMGIAAAIIALIPCFSPCCCTGLPFGAWALIVLLDADVKAAFNQRTGS